LKREVETGRFRVKTNAGKEYIVVQYQEYISVPSFDDPDETPGKKWMATSAGLLVNYIDLETFKIAQTGEIVRKIG
jgi:hypothetical protein